MSETFPTLYVSFPPPLIAYHVAFCSGPESRKIVDRYPVLTDYAERIHDVYFQGYEKWESSGE